MHFSIPMSRSATTEMDGDTTDSIVLGEGATKVFHVISMEPTRRPQVTCGSMRSLVPDGDRKLWRVRRV